MSACICTFASVRTKVLDIMFFVVVACAVTDGLWSVADLIIGPAIERYMYVLRPVGEFFAFGRL